MSRGVGPRSDPDDALAVAGAASAPAAAASAVLRVGSQGLAGRAHGFGCPGAAADPLASVSGPGLC